LANLQGISFDDAFLPQNLHICPICPKIIKKIQEKPKKHKKEHKITKIFTWISCFNIIICYTLIAKCINMWKIPIFKATGGIPKQSNLFF